jgi:hypothetical protein
MWSSAYISVPTPKISMSKNSHDGRLAKNASSTASNISTSKKEQISQTGNRTPASCELFDDKQKY